MGLERDDDVVLWPQRVAAAQALRYDIEILMRRFEASSTCRLCERLDCTHRAFPPLGQRLALDENSRATSPFGLPRAAD